MYRLMNAAVMPAPGTYTIRSVPPDEFAALVRQHRPVSYIGYPNAADMLERLCGVPVPVTRDSTPMVDGDTLLIARLKYRVNQPAAKGLVQAQLRDYEFFVCDYAA